MRRDAITVMAIGVILALGGFGGTASASTPAKAKCSKAAKAANGGKCPPATTTTTAPPGPLFTQTGSGTAQTATFKVPNNWNLAWTYDCTSTFGGTGNFIVEIYDYYPNSKSALDLDNQGVNQLGAQGKATDHYHSGGNTKYLSISSECPWTVTVTKA